MFVEMRVLPDLLATESTMYLVTRLQVSVCTFEVACANYLLLEEFESDLSDDTLEHPARLLVQLHDLAPCLRLSRVLRAELSLEDLAEEGNPRGHLSRVKQIRRNFDLNKITGTVTCKSPKEHSLLLTWMDMKKILAMRIIMAI